MKKLALILNLIVIIFNLIVSTLAFPKHEIINEPSESKIRINDKSMAKLFGFMDENIHKCPIPNVIEKNYLIFNKDYIELDLKALIKGWRKLHKQMILRYGSQEIDNILSGKQYTQTYSYDTLDQIFHDVNSYLICLQSH
ncbi:unnamed protein product [Brachionus calyciflorus]|uniref:Uncharacterized protein n=1 Tax=Brachionus calyciflorus TaxID=104777 RepID=A0A813NIH1_9BILA|nr:unnamed protein product [Brachionus calyciflorus]